MSMLDRDRYVLLTILLCFAGSFVLYDHLPHLLPIHWGIDGHINRELPKDPWGNDYNYRFPGENGRIDIFTYGADGRPGGEGLDADIGNWSEDR